MSNKKLLMILERSGENLAVSKTNDEYVLEGVFAQFGVENNNHRIYEEQEYLPHLDYLKKKSSENRLLGELDHPDKFDISLSKVSHLIEDVKYDAKKRQIVGRIKLLDTPSGQIAKNLVDTGVPISISSRAAGEVGENKKVQIKRIFTYDLVADPGFENAQLSKVNESFGFDNHDDIVAIYDVTTEFPAFLESMGEEIYTETAEKSNKNNMEKTSTEFVSVEEMNKYSLVLKEEIQKINSLVKDAIGFVQTRGDTVSVMNLPFSEEPVVQPAIVNPDLVSQLVRYGAIALAVLFAYFAILRPLLWPKPEPKPPEAPTFIEPTLPEISEAERLREEMLVQEETCAAQQESQKAREERIEREIQEQMARMREREIASKAKIDELVAYAMKYAKDQPQDASLLLRAWVSDPSAAKEERV